MGVFDLGFPMSETCQKWVTEYRIEYRNRRFFPMLGVETLKKTVVSRNVLIFAHSMGKLL